MECITELFIFHGRKKSDCGTETAISQQEEIGLALTVWHQKVDRNSYPNSLEHSNLLLKPQPQQESANNMEDRIIIQQTCTKSNPSWPPGSSRRLPGRTMVYGTPQLAIAASSSSIWRWLFPLKNVAMPPLFLHAASCILSVTPLAFCLHNNPCLPHSFYGCVCFKKPALKLC
jgi:hypothetical protein